MENTEYIGDGVYAIFDGYGIRLHTGHHEFPDNKVYLETDVFNNLVKFADKLLRTRGTGVRLSTL